MTHKRAEVRLPRELMVYSDVDGTLVWESNQIAPEVRKQIHAFVDSGYGFSLATGRSLAAVKRFLKQIPVNAPLVLCNGAYVFDPETKQAWWSSIQKNIVEDVLWEVVSLPSIRIYVERSDLSLWVSQPEVLLEPFVLQEDLKPVLWCTVDDVLKGSDILKIGMKLLDFNSDSMAKLQDTLSALLAPYRSLVRFCLSSENYIEILPAGISKWTGILTSQWMRGVKDASIYTIGDQFNDIEMLKYADVGFAMQNAAEEVKQAASITIGHVKHHAVAQLLENLINRPASMTL